MEFFNSIQQVQANWQPYKKWKQEQDDKEYQRQVLAKKFPASKAELEQASQYGRTLVDSINIMDQYSINKAEDVETATKVALPTIETGIMLGEGALALGLYNIPSFKSYVKKAIKEMEKSPNKQAQYTILLALAATIPTLTILPFFQVKFASYEKEASRIARYQAREDKLKDPKNFIIYDSEQIKEAKDIAKTLPTPVDKDKRKNSINPIANYNTSIQSIKTLIADHKNYLEWKQKHLKEEKSRIDSLNTIEPTKEQLSTAKRDQDNLLRIVRKIEINSQNYLNNVEMVCNIALISALGLGAIGGGIVYGITNLLQKHKIISISSQKLKSIRNYSPMVGGLALILATTSYFIKAQKEVAKIGRFKAKKELLSDPNNFITYSDEQLNSVKDLKAKPEKSKNLIEKTKDNFNFFFKLRKDFKEYEAYQKNEHIEEMKLQNALKKVTVSDKQVKDAKALQKNAFMTFEKMDEMTQRYVDDTEAATDIAKQYISSAANLASNIIAMFAIPKILNGKSNNSLLKVLPIFAPIAALIPAELKINQIKKEAGKIGTMKAMQDLQDPKHFVQNDN